MFGIKKEEQQKGILTIISEQEEDSCRITIKGYGSQRQMYETIKMLIESLADKSGKETLDITKDLAYDFILENI